MAGAYVKVFEKWLQDTSQKEVYSEEDSMEESGDEIDHCRTDTVMKEEDVAPVLFNNHIGSGVTSDGQQCFQDEPPILEPVRGPDSKQLEKTACDQNSHDQSAQDINSGQTIIESDIKNKMETCEIKEKPLADPEKCLHSKSMESENIFDKISLLSEVDDYPPPLIPSHEAHLTTVDAKDDENFTEKSYATLQNLSPNFCAMEADSTSEMFQVEQDNTVLTVRDKNEKITPNNDVCVECDSTCMLGTSPHVVSPGSVSVVDSDNLSQTPIQEEPTISRDENPLLNWSDFSNGRAFDSYYHKKLTENLGMGHENKMRQDHIDTISQERSEFSWDKECPMLEAVEEVHERKQMDLFKQHFNVDDPPVLSVIPPTRTLMSARKKRHTIDTVESISRSKQKSCARESKYSANNVPTAAGSKLFKNECQQTSSRKRKTNKSRTHSKSNCHPQKHRNRSQTLPIVDLISYSTHLSPGLRKFIDESSQLSVLQNRMHQLVSLLFPELTPDLNLMSPESSHFESLLKDLCQSLKEHDSNVISKSNLEAPNMHSDSIFDGDTMSKCDRQSPAEEDTVSNCIIGCTTANMGNDNVLCNVSDVELNDHYSSEHDLNEKSDLNNPNVNGQHLNNPQHSSVLSCSVLPEKENSDSITIHNSDFPNSMIPSFSRINITEEKEQILKNQPSVLLHKNPSAVHQNFFKLSCCVLQLLLPDLDVSLCKELADSPRDLLHFIDSVISSNLKSL